VLRVATENFSDGSRWDWLEIFVHEYCHMLQAIDNTKVWRDSSKPVDKIFYWIDDNDEYPKPTKADIRKVIAMESDCDRRAVEVIKNYKIPINVNRYIKRSNLYMWFYPEVHKRGKWVAKKKRMPYMIKEALDLAPAKFLPIEDYMTTPPELVKLFDKHTF
jgi:hypothetical protein